MPSTQSLLIMVILSERKWLLDPMVSIGYRQGDEFGFDKSGGCSGPGSRAGRWDLSRLIQKKISTNPRPKRSWVFDFLSLAATDDADYCERIVMSSKITEAKAASAAEQSQRLGASSPTK